METADWRRQHNVVSTFCVYGSPVQNKMLDRKSDIPWASLFLFILCGDILLDKDRGSSVATERGVGEKKSSATIGEEEKIFKHL